eukprot:scaffold79434_cov32-Tisochrysis_lutea.AAC.4
MERVAAHTHSLSVLGEPSAPSSTSLRRRCERTWASERRSYALSGQRSVPCRRLRSIRWDVLAAARSMWGGSAPNKRSINARCSTSSCVWKSNSPVHSSVRIQPMDHMSTGWPHPMPRVTSGGRYCRVHTMDPSVGSSRHVAPPKSTRRTEDDAGRSPGTGLLSTNRTFLSRNGAMV